MPDVCQAESDRVTGTGSRVVDPEAGVLERVCGHVDNVRLPRAEERFPVDVDAVTVQPGQRGDRSLDLVPIPRNDATATASWLDSGINAVNTPSGPSSRNVPTPCSASQETVSAKRTGCRTCRTQ
ncbi:hypothetical protein ACFQ1L_36785 [Phytohabitans flavus]|uniref:hypothetical protein n=1 Tax=Phytohabitans flavus TaxID=1076124 RepID=UPI003627B08B